MSPSAGRSVGLAAVALVIAVFVGLASGCIAVERRTVPPDVMVDRPVVPGGTISLTCAGGSAVYHLSTGTGRGECSVELVENERGFYRSRQAVCDDGRGNVARASCESNGGRGSCESSKGSGSCVADPASDD